jgi:hypothetical protein
MSVVCLVVAGLAIAGSVARRRAARTEELAVLRLLGIPPAQAGRSTWVESGLLAAATLAAAVAAGLLATRLLLPVLPLVRQDEYAVTLVTSIPLWVPLVVGVAAVTMLLAWGARLSLVPASATRPAILREEAGG